MTNKRQTETFIKINQSFAIAMSLNSDPKEVDSYHVIKIIELTVPFETNIEKEHTFKTNKYATLIQDIKDKHISSELTLCGSRLQRLCTSESNKIRIITILKSLDIKPSKR